MTDIYVYNAVGTSDLVPPAGFKSWIEFWFYYGRNIFRRAYYASLKCVACNEPILDNDDKVGAHVKKVGDSSGKIFIVPLCKSCNKRIDIFAVADFLIVPTPES